MLKNCLNDTLIYLSIKSICCTEEKNNRSRFMNFLIVIPSTFYPFFWNSFKRFYGTYVYQKGN